MDLLQEFILKYEIKGFNTESKKKLKYGYRVFLKKDRGGWGSGFLGVYIYYVDGLAAPDSIRECLRDYQEFYHQEEFGEGDKGFLLCTAIDEKLFSGLKRAKIENDEIRRSIKPQVLERTVETGIKEQTANSDNKKRQVFIVHGRDKAPALELARFIEKKYPIDAIFLQDEAHSGRTLIEKLEDYSGVDYALITLTPDDVGALKGEKFKDRSRQNVIFELGQFIGKIGRKKVCLLIVGDVELPSDLRGIGYLSFTKDVKECFSDVEKELKAAKII